ncbi:hypothetical protein F4678DRAFT_457843 [Xylaria arbuscula]|nr:hypothetical protein F4678DRAFT_457843 [Xylaria arbuscula]
MYFSVVVAAAIGAVFALPEPVPVITAAPELKDISAASSTDLGSACTSTDCWASYAECNGSLTFVYLCYTPPPCGTATSPDPYICPSKSSATSAVSTPPEKPITTTTTTFITSTAASASSDPTTSVACGA